MDLTKAQQLAKNDKFVLLTMLVLFSLMPLVGKLSWGMVGKFVAGIVLIFGAAAIVDVFIGGVA
eukprot:CAMPEP_0181285186 /NCGR_PEP_ID=MMETSP1097-20121128/15846_1 /TAXON_ID=35684 /ORGANISM="Pseudopedinella elastica, Strain CCMP716" /LENGTH=63 /DNA_ID=CAMNT_0023388757 /DNA_START=104 /DNA_END=295 /DNA_ORIENTATION=-